MNRLPQKSSRAGRWAQRLPGAYELCAQLHVSRRTVRTALDPSADTAHNRFTLSFDLDANNNFIVGSSIGNTLVNYTVLADGSGMNDYHNHQIADRGIPQYTPSLPSPVATNSTSGTNLYSIPGGPPQGFFRSQLIH